MSFPYKYTPLADKKQVLQAYGGKHLSECPTPSFVVDRKIFKENSEAMLKSAHNLKADFRAHVKTHKTFEGTVLQLGSGEIKTTKIVVSTLIEAWHLVPLVKEGKIDDILFSLPVVKSRLDELVALSEVVPHLRLMLDSKDQLDVLAEYSKKSKITKKWSLFIKVNMGTNRAGLTNDDVSTTLEAIFKTDIRNYVSVYGFYCHAGHSYSSHNKEQAKAFLVQEITAGNEACKAALEFDSSLKLQLSVGATPTAHSADILDVKTDIGELYGQLEIHAGNYPFNDLQQISTGCVDKTQVSIKVIAEVLSTYPNRGKDAPGEQLVNAGVIALAREFGPLPGHGRVLYPEGYENWIVGRLSQEHGILTPLESNAETKFIPQGTQVGIVPQHSCITAASYPWYLVTDGSDIVVDIWVPFRGW